MEERDCDFVITIDVGGLEPLEIRRPVIPFADWEASLPWVESLAGIAVVAVAESEGGDTYYRLSTGEIVMEAPKLVRLVPRSE